MVNPNVAVGGERPLDLIFRSPLHRELVEEVLGQIQFGLVS
jgi:uncharacterized protein (DUF2384 family)